MTMATPARNPSDNDTEPSLRPDSKAEEAPQRPAACVASSPNGFSIEDHGATHSLRGVTRLRCPLAHHEPTLAPRRYIDGAPRVRPRHATLEHSRDAGSSKYHPAA